MFSVKPRPRRIAELAAELMLAKGENDPNPRSRGRAIFLVGAGCSASAGIKMAAGVAQLAAKKLAVSFGLSSREISEEWHKEAFELLEKYGHFPAKFKGLNNQIDWSALYTYIFSEHYKSDNHQREVINEVIAASDDRLNWAHACLGELVHQRYVHTVLTTNFDQLVMQGILRTGEMPVVADGLESLNRISAAPTRPQVVHLHGSMHTYELRNSPTALQQTAEHGGLDAMLSNILKSSTVLVVVGYGGGEEGIMTLLQKAARSLSRLVVYWVAYERSFEQLSANARFLLSRGENKFFILGEDADEFFQKLMVELNIGVPGWIKDPLAVISDQAKRLGGGDASGDIPYLIGEYQKRVAAAFEWMEKQPDDSKARAISLSAMRDFNGARLEIEKIPDYSTDPEALRVHARALHKAHDPQEAGGEADLEQAIKEFDTLLGKKTPEQWENIVSAIEARIDLFDRTKNPSLLDEIVTKAKAAQKVFEETSHPPYWALLEFYRGYALQQAAELEKSTDPSRFKLVSSVYRGALPTLTAFNHYKLMEAREQLAGALIAQAELLSSPKATPLLLEARSIYQDVVTFARTNAPPGDLAGALTNLAGVYAIIAKSAPESDPVAVQHARTHLDEALVIYQAEGDNESVLNVQRQLAGIGKSADEGIGPRRPRRRRE